MSTGLPSTASRPSPPLNVGVYGTTRAGKTRFLYELLANWHRNYRIVEQSEQAVRFLQEIEPDIKAYNQSRGTVASVEGIQVVVKRGEDQVPWKLTFRDLRGEFLAKEIDDLTKENADKAASIPRQVRECNSFVFFFDPTSEDAPAELEAHHARELRRAEQFIDYVLAQRENRYLPILFVLTHLDRWESNARLRTRVASWIDRVNEKLRGAYRKALGKHFPTQLIDKDLTTLCVASVRANETEPVVHRLGELVRECDEFQRADRSRLRGVLGSLFWTLGLFAVIAATALWFVRDLGPSATTTRPTVPVRDWTVDQVREQLAELERQIKAHPSGRMLPSLAEAHSLNESLRWLPAKLDTTKDDSTYSPALRQQMQESLNRLVALVREKLAGPPGEPVAPRWEIVAAYLKDTPDSPDQLDLFALRREVWAGPARQAIVEELSTILRRREQVLSQPADTIGEVLSALRRREQALVETRIGGLKSQQALIEDLRTAATFLEDRKSSKGYGGTFRLTSARVIGANVSDLERALTWSSPGQEMDYKIRLIPGTVRPSEVTFTTKTADYPLKFGLGGPVKMQLYLWSNASEKYEPLRDFDIPAGPFRILGLPMLVSGQTTSQRRIEGGGYEIQFELSELPRAPLLLEEAVARLQGAAP